MSTQFDASEIVADLEAYIDELPAKRRRRPADDDGLETENYGGLPVDAASVHIELTHEQQVDLHLLLWLLADTKAAGQGAILKQIRAMLGLSCDSPAGNAARRYYGKVQGGAK